MARTTDRFAWVSASGAVALCVASAVAGCSTTTAAPRAPADEAGIRWYDGARATEKVEAGAPGDDETMDLDAPSTAPPTRSASLVDPVDLSGGSLADGPDLSAFVAAGDRARTLPRNIAASPRARVGKATTIDVASLPLAEEVATSAQSPGARFRIVSTKVVPKCPPSYVPRERTEFHLAKSWTLPAVLRLGGEEIPAVELAGVYEDASGLLGRVFQRGPHRAEWTIIDEPRRSAHAVSITTFEGRFDRLDHSATASRKFTATARAIVPALVYAFRRCEERCDRPFGDPERVEILTLVGPPAGWIGSTGDTDEQQLLEGQPFTQISDELRPGSSASLAISVTPEAARAFGFALMKTPIADTTTYALEVVWPAGEDPEITLFEETLPGAATPSSPFSYGPSPEQDCVRPNAYEYGLPIP